MLKMSFDMPKAEPVGPGLHRHVFNGPTMGTRYSAIIMSEESEKPKGLDQALFEAVNRVDRQMSTWNPASDLMRLNRAEPGQWTPVPRELFTVLTEAMVINRASSGLFDPAVGDMVDAWGFGAPSREPDPLAIRQQLGRGRPKSCDLIELDPDRLAVRKSVAVKLDLSGIAKGYGVDAMADVLADFGIENGLVGIDGEMRAMGAKAGDLPWSVALEKPDYTTRAALGMLQLSDCAIATSGDYRQWVKVGNQTFSHTMDPRRGGPLQNDVASVSVIAERCMTADAWATALMVMGHDAGVHVARAKGINALFVVRDGDRLRQVAVGPLFGVAAACDKDVH
ncbi:FAD:protein FMN transferase [Cohaesibacter haloalkalitolerans]|uniref:FAD:protein FMN transferase n=1 Tax=Cohaesibacter haloalkalitolerans TaxID=1162980 RepID=UPI003CCAAA61